MRTAVITKIPNILVVLLLGIALHAPLCGAPVQEKKQQSACSNDIVILTCKKSCQDQGNLVWMKDGKILRDRNDTRYSMKSFGEDYQLVLLSVSVNDSGDYYCQVDTPSITRIEVTTLHVKGGEACRINKEKHDVDHSVKQYPDTCNTNPILYVILVLTIIPYLPQWLKNKMSDIGKSCFEKLSTFVHRAPKPVMEVSRCSPDDEDADLLRNADTSSRTQHARHTEIDMGIVDSNKEYLPSSTLDSAVGDEISSVAENP